MIALRSIDEDDWLQWREMRLAALREAPYAFSSTLADWRGKADTEERWRSRLANVPLNLIADFGGVPAGMVSATAVDRLGAVELISMWVAPFARGRGVGDRLVCAVVEWAAQQRAARVVLAVMQTNPHAARLYRRHGFVDAGFVEGNSTDAPAERRMVRELNPRPSAL